MPDVTIESVLRQPPAPSAPLDFSLTQEHTRIDWSNSRFKRVWSRKRATSRSDGNLTDIASVLSASRNATPSPTSPHAERSSSPQTATSSTPPRSSSLRSQSPSSFQTKDHSPKLRLRIAPTGSSSTAPISPPLLPQSPRADSPPSQAPVLSSPASKLNPLRVPRVLPSSIVAKLGGRGNRASTIFPNSGVSVPEIEFKMDEMKIADRAGTRGHFKFPPPDTPTTASTSANAAPPADRMHGTAHTQMQIIATPAANPRSRPMSIAPSLPSNPRPSARGTPPPPPNRHRNNTTPSAPRYVSPPVLVSDLLSPPKLTGPPSSGSTPEPIPMRDPPPPRHPKVSIEKVAWMTTDVDSGFRSDAETIRETRVKKLSTFIHTPPPSHPSRQRINSNNANNAKFTLESVSLNTSSITRSTARANAVSAAATGGAMALELGKRGWAGMERLLNGSGSTRVRNPNTGAGSSSCPPTSGLMGRHGGGSTTSFASDSMPELMSGSMVALPSPTRVALRKSGVVFGANLEDAVWETKVDTSDWLDEHGRKRGVNCPALVVRCIQHLEKWGVDEEGIFRITGRTTHGAKLKAEFDSGADYDLRLCTPVDIDPHAVSSVFKLYLRELPEPILTRPLLHLFDKAMSADESAAPGDTVTAPTGLAGFGGQADGMNLRAQTPALIADLKSLIQRLPRPNFDLLHEICRLLRCTSDAHQTTRMPLSNLLVVFSPSLKLNSALLKALVEEQEVIFEQPEESGGGSPLPPPYQSRAPVVPSSAPPPEPEKTLRRRSATIPLPSAPNAHLASRDPPPPVPPLPPQLVSQPPTSGGPTPHPQTPPAAGTQSHPPTSTRSIRSLLAITSPNPAPTTPARPPRPPRRPSIGLLFSKQSSPNGSTTSSPAPHDAQRCFLPMNTVASTLAAHAPNPSPLTPLPSSGGTTAATPHMNERNHLPIADLLRPSPPIPVPNRPAHRAESPHQRSVGSVSSTASSPPPRVGLFESRMSQSRVEDEWMKAVLEAAGAEKKHPR